MAFFMLSAVLFGQNTGTLHGTVLDPSGSAVPGARIAAIHLERGTLRTTETDQQGAYVLPFMTGGVYSVSVEAEGFKKFTRQGVTVKAEDNVRVDARLEIGKATEAITVTADAPQVDSRSSTLGTMIDGRSLIDMPLEGRNIIDLAVLLPGVSDVSAPQMFTGDRSGPTFSTSGSRTNQNSFQFDGTQFNGLFRNTGLNFPPPDVLREVKVLTNQYSAEFGRNAGTVFNVVTKGGSNNLHGAAWEFLRNNALNASSFANHLRNKLIQNQFGATLGGPIKRNKLFFFGSYEGLKVRPNIVSSNVNTITALERAGDFSMTTGTLRDPLDGLPFPGRVIPVNRLDPVAVNAMKRVVAGTAAGGGTEVFIATAPQNNTHLMGRLDYNAGIHTFDLRYNYTGTNTVAASGNVPTYLMMRNEAAVNSVTVGDTWVMGPNLVQQIRIGYNRFGGSGEPTNRFDLNDLGGKFPSFGPSNPPNLVISSRMTLGGGTDARTVNESRQFRDSFSWIRGPHNLKFGVDAVDSRYLNRSWWQSSGIYQFTGRLSGNPSADFMLGLAESMVVGVPVLEQAARQWSLAGYLQDDWKVAPRLTLNLGLRYEVFWPWKHPTDFWGTFHPGQQSTVIPNAPVGMVYPGDAGTPRGMIPTDTNNFAPRIGFAWDVFGNGKTAIRGGYGIVYEALNADIVQNTGQPFRYTFTFQLPQSLSDPLAGRPAIPLTVNVKNPMFVGPYELFYADPSMRNPYVQQFSLGVTREVLRDLAVTASYVGKLGRKLPMGLSANYGLPAEGATLANLNQRRIHQGFGDLQKYTTQANSSYNAMQIQAIKRYARGFMIQGAYTFSRSLDVFSSNAMSPASPQPWNLRDDWGLSDFHAKNTVTVAWSWELPRLTSLQGSFGGAVRWLAGGWQVTGRVTARSGHPLNIVSGSDIGMSGTPRQRADAIGDPVLPSGRDRGEQIERWFDPAAFARPASGMYGNAGRNAVLGPPASTNVAGLNKNFPVPGREGMVLQFRSEFFNAMNHTTLTGVNTTLGTNLGRVSGFGPNRVIQLAAKIVW